MPRYSEGSAAEFRAALRARAKRFTDEANRSLAAAEHEAAKAIQHVHYARALNALLALEGLEQVQLKPIPVLQQMAREARHVKMGRPRACSPDLEAQIRATYARGGITTRGLARCFGISNALAARIVKGLAVGKAPRTGTPEDARTYARLVNEAVPDDLPDDLREEVSQDLLLSLLEGRVAASDISRAVRAHLQAVWKRTPTRFGPLSLDAPLGNDPDAPTLLDFLAQKATA